MSAGLHHRWRARTVGPGRVGPGDGARRLLGHRRPGARAGRRVGAAGGWWDSTSPLRCSSWRRASQAAGRRSSGWRATRSSCRSPTRASTPPPSASACATSPTSPGDRARWRGRAPRRPRRDPRDHDAQRPPLKWFYSVWFDRIVPLLGRGGRPRGLHYLPDSVRRFPAHELAELMHEAGLRDVRYVILAGGIVAIHAGTVPDGSPLSAADDTALLRRGPDGRADAGGAHPGAGRGHVRRSASGGRDADRGRQAPAPAARAAVRRRGGGRAAGARRRGGRAGPHGDARARRRGRPRARCAAAARRCSPRGRAAATATGDFVFSRAFALLAQNEGREQVRVLADACLALAAGELAQRRDAYRDDVTEERYVLRCRLKTASLFAAACRLGALAAGRSAPAAEAARSRRSARTSASPSRCSTTCWT